MTDEKTHRNPAYSYGFAEVRACPGGGEILGTVHGSIEVARHMAAAYNEEFPELVKNKYPLLRIVQVRTEEVI